VQKKGVGKYMEYCHKENLSGAGADLFLYLRRKP
jgi:hypothetical protein